MAKQLRAFRSGESRAACVPTRARETQLEVTIAALRNRNDWEWIVGELLEFKEEIIGYFTGELSAGELLEKLNDGKSPHGHSKT